CHRCNGYAGGAATVPPPELVAHADERVAIWPATGGGDHPSGCGLGDSGIGRDARGVDAAVAHAIESSVATGAGCLDQSRRSSSCLAFWWLAVSKQSYRAADGLRRPFLFGQRVSTRDGGVLHGSVRYRVSCNVL